MNPGLTSIFGRLTQHGQRLASFRSELYSAAALVVALLFVVQLGTARSADAAEPFDRHVAEQTMWGLLNQERVEAGVKPLVWVNDLRDIARWRSSDMLTNDYFSHAIPSCGGCDVYRYYTEAGLDWSYAGENIAWNSGYSNSESPRRAHTALMNSSGHRANILNPRFTHGAIGAFGLNGVDWLGHLANPRIYTQLFMTAPAGRELSFRDIASSKFIDEIEWAAETGVTYGCGDDKFCPNGVVTRAQMASFLTRVLDLPPTSRDYFGDDRGNTHEDAINRLRAAGITFGCDENRYCPNGVVTRAQMASFLVRAYNLPANSDDLFDDDRGNTHEANINALGASHITYGCGDDRYCPNGAVTRGQMVAFLYRAEHR